MATGDPQLPTSLEGPPRGGDRRANATTPPTQSKRDKKRALLVDRLVVLNDKFTRDRDVQYREQLQKIQIDTSLAMKVDPYADRPLDFIAPTRKDREQALLQDPDPENRSGGRSLIEMAGSTFHDWHQSIEDLVEERDSELTKQKYEYDKKEREHKNVYTYKTEVAKREHDALSSTLRDRLMNSIAAKKHRITKEKEAADISDASALLLHPNQFSLNNPASPSGAHNKRTTRLRQNADDISGMGDGRKRKRVGADDDGSPAPQRRAADANGTTPFWQGDRMSRRNVTGPIYSIDKLFTDKELSMTYNAAALASHKFLQRNKVKLNGSGNAASSPSGSESGDHDDGNHQDGGGGGGGGSSAPPPAAAMMERVPSHATRSTRGAQNQNFLDDKVVGMEALANFEMPGNLEKMAEAEPKMPPMFLTSYAKPNAKNEANTPATLAADDVNSDLMVMKMLCQYEGIHGAGSNFDTSNGARRVLEASAFSVRDGRYVAYLHHEKRDPEELRKELKLPAIRDDPVTPSGPVAAIAAPPSGVVGASPMSRQSSQGGVAMSRQGSNTRAGRKRLQ